MMRLKPQIVPQWPKLAWVARFGKSAQEIDVLHGPMVEVSDEWIVEAVWAGDFAAGDFDRTDLVFGTGIRVRGEKIVFVSSGTVFDRLLYCRRGDTRHVSNSLPALLAVSGSNLRDDYLDYSRDARSITKGLENRVHTIPTDAEDVFSVFFNNLVFDGRQMVEEPKVDTAPHFGCFQDYYDFLVATARRLGENAASPQRQHRVSPLSSISSGYDSSATATISRHAGCRDTVSIRDSTSLWRGSDSGAHVAKLLGMSCKQYDRTAKQYPLEETIWAAEGRPGVMNWTLFDYPEPLCLFFTGCHGEKLWDRVDHDHPDPFVRRDPSSLGFCEFRLFKGVFQCPMPFWGVRHSHELRAITATEEMRPWYMMRDHDKPIARRIVEEAGVPRRAFGLLNKNTSLEKRFPWPKSSIAQHSFREYLSRRGCYVPPNWLARLTQVAADAEILLYRNVTRKFRKKRRPKPWDKMAARYFLFHWANDELKRRYLEGLRNVQTETPVASEVSGS